MTGEGFVREKLNTLKALVEEGCGTNLDMCKLHFMTGAQILEDLEHSPDLPAPAKQLVLQIRRSLSDYYNIIFNRSWTKKFLLDDIAALERLCVNTPPEEIKFPEQPYRPFDRPRDAA